jgi:DNA-binding transcriptional regulator YiaG
MNIAEIRKKAGITLRAFGDEVGVTERSVANWEKHGKTPDKLHPLFRAQVEKFIKRHNITEDV